jgi:hypothetical protein
LNVHVAHPVSRSIKTMKRLIVTAVYVAALLSAGAGASMAADGPGSCGKGKVWNPDTQSCVAKPKKGAGSGSNSG